MVVKCGVFQISQNIETIHNQYLKYILKIGSRSINNIVLGELGRFKLKGILSRECLISGYTSSQVRAIKFHMHYITK